MVSEAGPHFGVSMGYKYAAMYILRETWLLKKRACVPCFLLPVRDYELKAPLWTEKVGEERLQRDHIITSSGLCKGHLQDAPFGSKEPYQSSEWKRNGLVCRVGRNLVSGLSMRSTGIRAPKFKQIRYRQMAFSDFFRPRF